MIVCIPDVLDLTELRQVRSLLGSDGFTEGSHTAGHRAMRVKHNLQLRKDAPGASEVKDLVLAGLKRNPVFQRVTVAKHIRRPMISRYEPGMNYGRHVDDALMGKGSKVRTDLSVTVFLSDLGDYDGGELVIDEVHEAREIKLPAGAAAVYPSGCLHRVAPVTRGARLAAVTWVESYVRDPIRREILHDLDLVRRRLMKDAVDWDETDLAYKVYANLLRLWADT